MKALIVFPLFSMEDALDEPLIIEAIMEGYLVRRVYVDQGASVEVMFEHCFENLSPAIRSRLRGTQMDLVGFAGGVVKPLGKIELEVVFGDGGADGARRRRKIAFYPDQGVYCYTKMPFGLKNVGATYQRLVDTAFQSQIGRNLEAYVDDMVIKSNDEKVLIKDIAETFDNLRRINMKLNPKKCIPRDEKGHSRAAVANHPSEGGNVIRIRGSDNGGRKCRIAGRKKGETMSDTLREQDVERSREELCPVGKIGHVIVAHVQEVTK
ncbi:reverse transcriptase domain-containing protein, partial [Tanacetum coccineum]